MSHAQCPQLFHLADHRPEPDHHSRLHRNRCTLTYQLFHVPLVLLQLDKFLGHLQDNTSELLDVVQLLESLEFKKSPTTAPLVALMQEQIL